MSRIRAPVLSRKLDVLFADVRPVDDSDGQRESFSMWCVPFNVFAEEIRDPEMKELAGMSIEYSMLPLSGEYCLFLGAIDCDLTNICVQSQTPVRNSVAETDAHTAD
jgi:hypothetical protein